MYLQFVHFYHSIPLQSMNKPPLIKPLYYSWVFWLFILYSYQEQCFYEYIVPFFWLTHACISIGWIIGRMYLQFSQIKLNTVPSLLHCLSLSLTVYEISDCQHLFVMLRSIFTRAWGIKYRLNFNGFSLFSFPFVISDLVVVFLTVGFFFSFFFSFFQSRCLCQNCFAFKEENSEDDKENCLQT